MANNTGKEKTETKQYMLYDSTHMKHKSKQD